MVEIIDFPSALTITNRMDPHLVFNTISGDMAFGGIEQVLAPESSVWQWEITIPAFSENQIKALRILRSRAKGRFNYIRIGLCDSFRITREDVGLSSTGPVPHSDGSLFSDGSGYDVSQPSSEIIADTPRNSSLITIQPIAEMSAGIFVSIDYWLYHIDDWYEDDDGNYAVQISPPLREPVAAGDQVDFTATSIWVFDSDTTARLDLLIGRFGSVDIGLREPVGRRFDAS